VTPADRVALLQSTMAAAYPARMVTRDLVEFDHRKKEDLAAGIYSIVSLGEGGYANHNGREGMDGTHRILLVGQVKLAEKTPPSQVEDAEFAMAEEVKALMRALPAGLCNLVMTGFEQSGQADAPYGWIAVKLEAKE